MGAVSGDAPPTAVPEPLPPTHASPGVSSPRSETGYVAQWWRHPSFLPAWVGAADVRVLAIDLEVEEPERLPEWLESKLRGGRCGVVMR
jgi:hypothetical protein